MLKGMPFFLIKEQRFGSKELLDLFQGHPVVQKIANRLRKQTRTKIKLEKRDRFARGFYRGCRGTRE